MSNREAPLSVRVTPELKQRLEDAAKSLGISSHGLAALAIEAGVGAVEKGGGRIALPIEFTTTHAVVEKTLHAPPTPLTGPIKYPSHRSEFSKAEEKPRLGKKKKAA